MADASLAVAVPASALLHDAIVGRQIEDVAFEADAAGTEHVELGDAERRCHLIFNHFGFHANAGGFVTVFQCGQSADIDAAGTVEFQSTTARCCFRAAEHHANFLTNLVDEDDAGFRAGDCTGQFSHGLTHHACLKSHVSVANFSIEFCFGNEGGDGIDHDDIDGVGANEHLGDLQGLFAVRWLADEQFFQIDAEPLGPGGIERMFGIDEGADAT